MNKPRPGLRFTWLGILTAGLIALIVGGSIWSNASWNPNLALDLEGGTSIILEPQVEDADVTTEQLEQAVSIIRQRVDATGVSEAEITTQGDRNIVVNLPGNPDEETRDLVRSSAQLAFRRVAVVAAPEPQTEEAPAEEEDPAGPELTDEEQQRLDELLGGGGDAAPEDQPAGGGEVTGPAPATAEDRGVADEPAHAGGAVPGPAGSNEDAPAEDAPAEEAPAEGAAETFPRFDPLTDTTWMNEEILARFAELDCTDPANRTGGDSGAADEPIVSCAQDGSAKFVLGPVELDGSHVTDASFGYEVSSAGTQTNNLAVTLEFDDYGTEVFGQITGAITGQQPPYNQFAIVLDGLVLSAPESRTPVLDGRAQITGTFSQEEAETLANQLKNGALPISFQVQSEQQISPTLGADYLAKGVLAGVIGLLLVVVYSLFQYRALGLVTVSSLVVAGVLTYLLLLLVSWRYGYRLSLAGVAGIIVGIGMTADSFIVYFERVRDEIRSGRRLLSAVEIGWDRAKRTIYASKAVNMLAAVILYILAVGNVRGFAFTLGLTVIVDILVVVLFTHPMLQVLARTRFFGEGHRMSGMDPRQLGVSQAAYRGAMGLDLEKARAKSTKRGSGREAERRQAAAERKRAGTAGRSLAERKSGRTLAGRSGGTALLDSDAPESTDAAVDETSASAEDTGLSLAERKARARRQGAGDADPDGEGNR
ncbi:protein translocase subunit SecD [Brevibacterium ihuae]|uniref:protein translocase subunit SecD n=1 Tax=Brevibacterium ihuae TaxID=1631743 RepID=UPI001FE2D4B6|nr:protein translocase subunit SecD [Brevibacterium ihuae]